MQCMHQGMPVHGCACHAAGGADETVQLWSASGAAAGASSGAPAPQPADAAPGSAEQGSTEGEVTAGPSVAPPQGAAAGPTRALAHAPLTKHHTKASSVTRLQFSNRNLLLAAGSFRKGSK